MLCFFYLQTVSFSKNKKTPFCYLYVKFVAFFSECDEDLAFQYVLLHPTCCTSSPHLFDPQADKARTFGARVYCVGIKDFDEQQVRKLES